MKTTTKDYPKTYREFLAAKHLRSKWTGIDVPIEQLNGKLFDWQKPVVQFLLRCGRVGAYEECGLGKTAQELEFCHQILRNSPTAKRALILTPLAVAAQTIREADKFGINDVRVVKDQSQVATGINVCNYERLHKLDASTFDIVVCDEASLIADYTGKTKQALCRDFSNTPYRMVATATPARNDLLELGNYADFLGIMKSNEMISRWFINDSMQAGKYRLKNHGAKDFWRWMASYSVGIERPSDLGFSDDGYDLPPLEIRQEMLDCEGLPAPTGQLFHTGRVSATGIHHEKRATAAARSAKVRELIDKNPDDFWLIWCDTNYEADALIDAIPFGNDVRGSMPVDEKELILNEFALGYRKVLISKPSVCGFGMNFQHCHRVAYAGLTFSFESFYQSLRRTWRYGQRHPVTAHIVVTDCDALILRTITRKEVDHKAMQSGMAAAMRESMFENLFGNRQIASYSANERMMVPEWLRPKL